METVKFMDITGSETAAMTYLAGACLKAGVPRCPACGCEKLYNIEKNRRKRCAMCGHSFNLFSGRWISRSRLKALDWLRILRLFEIDETATAIAARTGVSYPAVLRAVTTLRMAILHEHDGPIRRESPAECGGEEEILGFVAGAAAGAICRPVPEKHILFDTTVGGHRMIFTDRDLDCGSLLVSGERLEMIDTGEEFPGCRVFSAEEGFWTYARERLKRYHGFSTDSLPLYLTGIELRWENGDAGLFDLLVEKVCEYVDA